MSVWPDEQKGKDPSSSQYAMWMQQSYLFAHCWPYTMMIIIYNKTEYQRDRYTEKQREREREGARERERE